MTDPVTSEPDIGWGSEFHLSPTAVAGALVELDHVLDFGLPNDQADRQEVTHYKSPEKRKQYIQGLFDGGTVAVRMSYHPGSDNDVLVRAAKADGKSHAFKMVLPVDDGTWEISGTCVVLGYERTNPVGAPREATMTISIDSAVDEAAGA